MTISSITKKSHSKLFMFCNLPTWTPLRNNVFFFQVLLVIVTSIFLLTSCYTKTFSNTKEEIVEIEDEDITTTEVLNRLIKKNPVRGLIALNKYLKLQLITEDEFSVFENKTLDDIKKTMRQHYLGENYLQTLHYLDIYTTYQLSTHELNEEFEPLLDRKELLLQIINSSIQEGNYPLTQEYSWNLLNLDKEFFTNSEVYLDVLKGFENYQFPQLYEALCNNENTLSDTCPGEINNNNLTINDMLSSTFVIDIDKGITVDGLVHEIGSAFFISSDGYALTNYHVIKSEVDADYKGKSEMTVKLKEDNFRPRQAEVIGYDSLVDLALIKVKDVQVKNVFQLHATTQVVPGNKITVIGSPIGLTNTVTSGIISSEERGGLSEIGTVIQMDASVNPGNSGGPLLDEKNNVVGVVVAKIQGFENINFAIPSVIVTKVLPKLFKGEKVEHSWLGVGGYLTEKGFEILYIAPNSAAENADLLIGDTITKINDTQIKNISTMQIEMLDWEIDSLVEVSIIRQGNTSEEKLLLASSERSKEIIFSHLNKNTLYKIFPILSGAQIETINYQKSYPQYRITKVYPESPAEFIGFTPGDIIGIRKLFFDKGRVQMEIRVLQQSRGFLEDIFSAAFPISTKNFL